MGSVEPTPTSKVLPLRSLGNPKESTNPTMEPDSIRLPPIVKGRNM